MGRVVILTKVLFNECKKQTHPKAIVPVRMNGLVLSGDIIHQVLAFTFIYLCVLLFSCLVLMADGIGFEESLGAVVSALGNVGPGLGSCGPVGNYADFPVLSKWVLSFVMVLDMSCAACATRVDKTLRKQTGVYDVSVNYASATASVDYDPSVCNPEALKQALQDAGYDLLVDDANEDITDQAEEAHKEFLETAMSDGLSTAARAEAPGHAKSACPPAKGRVMKPPSRCQPPRKMFSAPVPATRPP